MKTNFQNCINMSLLWIDYGLLKLNLNTTRACQWYAAARVIVAMEIVVNDLHFPVSPDNIREFELEYAEGDEINSTVFEGDTSALMQTVDFIKQDLILWLSSNTTLVYRINNIMLPA